MKTNFSLYLDDYIPELALEFDPGLEILKKQLSLSFLDILNHRDRVFRNKVSRYHYP